MYRDGSDCDSPTGPEMAFAKCHQAPNTVRLYDGVNSTTTTWRSRQTAQNIGVCSSTNIHWIQEQCVHHSTDQHSRVSEAPTIMPAEARENEANGERPKDQRKEDVSMAAEKPRVKRRSPKWDAPKCADRTAADCIERRRAGRCEVCIRKTLIRAWCGSALCFL